ncbi:MAG TPA: hypothetical protein V6C85_01700 [Allocoleopsis sp.]
MKLIYRGYIFNYTPRPLPTYRKPQALNWRWLPPGESMQCVPHSTQRYGPPRALNWRFQVPMEM